MEIIAPLFATVVSIPVSNEINKPNTGIIVYREDDGFKRVVNKATSEEVDNSSR